jgi:uncharacterized membrane protein
MSPVSTSLVVRLAHVVAMAVALGGSLLLWPTLARGPARLAPDGVRVAAAARYERLFWAAAGVLVTTGVGNLGAFGAALPRGDWGAVFALKLLAVVTGLPASALRTLLVARCRAANGPTVARPLALAYGVTTVWLVALVVLAEVLAHG